MDKTKEDSRRTLSARCGTPRLLRCDRHRRRGLRPVEECSRVALPPRCMDSRRLARAARRHEVCWSLQFQHQLCLHCVPHCRQSDLHRLICTQVVSTLWNVGHHPERRDHRGRRWWTREIGQSSQDEGRSMVTPNKRAAGQRRSSLLVRFGRRWSGVPERGR